MTGEMRVLDSEIGKVVPVVDIAEMIGYHRSAITKAIHANKGAFEGLKTFQSLPTTGGEQAFLCLNETGVERLFLVISPSSKTKQDLFQKVEEFRMKAFGKLVEKKIAVIPHNGNGDLKKELLEATEYAKIIQCDARILQAAIFKKHGETELADALQPTVTRGETGWYNPTRLVTLCNDPDLTPERLNWYLKNKGYQYKDGFIWRLTPEGAIHGREYVYEAPSGHKEIRISWRESILYASGLKRSPDTMALVARA
jgi:hypothetical protein